MKVSRLLVVAGVGFFALPGPTGAQGLGDVAKKEKQRRESVPAPRAKTYTQEDVAGLPPVANEPSEAEGEPATPPVPLAAPVEPPRFGAGAPAEPDAEVDSRARDEERWRSRVAGQRQRVEDARQKHATLASLNLVPGYEYVDGSGRTVALDDTGPPARRVERLTRWRCRVLALPYGDQGLLIERGFYQAVGGFRPLPLMEDVTTKAEDVLALKDGRMISPSVLTHPFKPMHCVEQSQIIQEDYDRITIRIVPNERYRPADSEHLIREFKARMGGDMQIRVDTVAELPRTRSGKFKWVISRVVKGIKVPAGE